ncbi:Putative Zinc finger, PHD-type, Zinc finger, FYVE/PHD-type, Zinc finger, RING/FYVE/PHD-type [Septoria linicola]|uniref:Zinc finger, PHD-type, Zinc finger, FYVE/PHD-type, Zinc finger, RING/FYVE/PHD-type n=1 Tax=Septoria linicola TaxID=215465 RepID=A0A9Q9ARB7_9PEZI|nr:Putative Zinc finger, PHD-type, Zinc finger, FYVE/PHD-type, Zinc finger, RING/FYVE/PHD-type [Septoria linicola]
MTEVANHLNDSTSNKYTLDSPDLGTPFAKKFEVQSESSHALPRLSSNHCISPSVSFDAFHDAIAGAEPAMSFLSQLPAEAFSWRRVYSMPPVSQRKAYKTVSETPRLRRVGSLKSSPAGSTNLDLSIEAHGGDFELEAGTVHVKESRKSYASVRDTQKRTPIRGSKPSTDFTPSYSNMPSLVTSSETLAEDSDKEVDKVLATPRSLNRKKKQENLRLKYNTSQPEGSESEASDYESAIVETAVEMSSNKVKLRPTPKNDTLIWQDVFCICGRSFHPAHGEMSECVACDQWYHLRCVGVEHLSEHYKNKPFYCPSCEEIGVVEDVVMD